MIRLAGAWLDRLRAHQKVAAILLGVFVPLVAALAVHVSLINHLLIVQQQHDQTVTVRQQILILRRLAADIEDAFRGFLLTRQDWFLRPLEEAETKLSPTVARAMTLVEPASELAADVRNTTERLAGLLESKQALIRQIQAGHEHEELEYVRSGKGLALSDEIGKLAQSFEEMARRIRQQIQELEAISASGHEISTIGPDGLAGVLRRITDRAAELLQVDVCLVMLRNEQMGCWVVEAASGEWNEKLDQTVMLWEEFPICVQAFESRQPAFGENVLQDGRPEVLRRNLIGQSMLSIPLLFQGSPFGVLVLLQERVAAQEDWQACLRLAEGFADEAAIAIANARLYEALSQKEKGLESRLRELEHLAETLAHDLKAPGERMESLASLLLKEYGGAPA